LHNVVRKWSFA